VTRAAGWGIVRGRLAVAPSRDARAVAAAAATGILVGAAIVATRSVVDQVGPGSLAFLRYLVGVLLLLPVALAAGPTRFAARDVGPICLLGIGQFGVLIVLLNYGLRFIPSARGALIFATMPLLTMLLGAALRLERLSWPTALGVLLTLGGVGLSLGEKALARGGGAGAWLGEAAAFASALVGAVCSLLYRPFVRRYAALAVSALAMLASVLFLAALAAGEGFFARVPPLGAAGWAAVAFIGLASGVGYYFWLWALGHAPATRVAAFLALSPITSAALGALVLGEPLSAGLVAGLGLVVLGLWLAHRRAV
jgi:drug/metabolite transporter (DMT)-like permease